MSQITLARRTVAGCLGASCVAGLAGCSSYGGSSTSAEAAEAAGSDGPARAVAGTGDVPVGGGLILPDHEVVLTQPTAGTFLAFSFTCTHQGCAVTEVDGDEIVCPCHGSRFALDGTVAKGPASSPLASREVVVKGADLLL
jgi:Rieske Fe-S protein